MNQTSEGDRHHRLSSMKSATLGAQKLTEIN